MSPETPGPNQPRQRTAEERLNESRKHVEELDGPQRLALGMTLQHADVFPTIAKTLLANARDASDKAADLPVPQNNPEAQIARLDALIHTNKVELYTLNVLDKGNTKRIDDLLNALPVYSAQLKALQKNLATERKEGEKNDAIESLPPNTSLLNVPDKKATIDGVPTPIHITSEKIQVDGNSYKMKYRARLKSVEVTIQAAVWLGKNDGIQLKGVAYGTEDSQELSPDQLLPVLRQMKSGTPKIEISKKVFLQKA